MACFPSPTPHSSWPSSLSKLHDHSHTLQLVWLLWTGDRPDAVTYTWQHTALTTVKHSCLKRDSHPQSHQASGHRPTSLTARSVGLATYRHIYLYLGEYDWRTCRKHQLNIQHTHYPIRPHGVVRNDRDLNPASPSNLPVRIDSPGYYPYQPCSTIPRHVSYHWITTISFK